MKKKCMKVNINITSSVETSKKITRVFTGKINVVKNVQRYKIRTILQSQCHRKKGFVKTDPKSNTFYGLCLNFEREHFRVHWSNKFPREKRTQLIYLYKPTFQIKKNQMRRRLSANPKLINIFSINTLPYLRFFVAKADNRPLTFRI